MYKMIPKMNSSSLLKGVFERITIFEKVHIAISLEPFKKIKLAVAGNFETPRSFVGTCPSFLIVLPIHFHCLKDSKTNINFPGNAV